MLNFSHFLYNETNDVIMSIRPNGHLIELHVDTADLQLATERMLSPL